MTRREMKVFVVSLVAFVIISAGLMVGLGLLGAADELIAILIVAAFSITGLVGGFLFDEPPSRQR